MVKKEAEGLEKIIAGIRDFKKKTGVQTAYLFGSYARGQAGKDSDVDLLLLSDKFENKPFHKRTKGFWLKWRLDLPVDFICYTPKEFEREKMQVSLVSQALKEAIVI